ncbi:MAG: hypothetical protein HUN04_26635 [Desulfobacter sp.]|nr:MAG: hypothetical protein HUN04_26635 [Desulfobacter sp.]
MTQTNRFWKFVLISLTGILLCVAGLLAHIWLNLTLEDKTALLNIFQNHIYTLLGLAFIVAGALWVVFDITYNRYILPLKRMSAEAGMIYASNPSHRIRVKGSSDIRNMAGIINDFADMFENLNKTITEQILAARKETEKERNLLAAIMGELPQGIVVCNKNGRILLFNSLAKTIFSPSDRTASQELFLGLGRSIFHLMDKALVAHALDEIIEQINSPDLSVGSFFISPVASGTLISAEAIPVLDNEKRITGFILAVTDISKGIEKYQAIDRYLKEFGKMLNEHNVLIPGHLGAAFEKTAARIRSKVFSSLPLSSLPLATFLSGIQKKTGALHDIRVNVFNPPKQARILADTYSMTTALIFIFSRLNRSTGVDEFDLHVSQAPNTIEFNISWEGSLCSRKDIDKMLVNRLEGMPSLGYVLKFNNARLTPLPRETRACSGLFLTARAGTAPRGSGKQHLPVISDSRPEFYDFNLFSLKDMPENLLDSPLKKTTYTVFDTETTGLNPDSGDEIISIGGVRIVNCRIVYQDAFEELIDPQREIPVDSYKIHGINYEMVRGKETIETVLPRFRQFVGNTVLLGHNLAFDMKMLKVKEASTQVRFENPVLDTLLLSAALHPVHQQHDMENIARRLGVSILGRHTALGDAITTAEIFLKLLPILNSNGILTLKDALNASQKTYYARLKY